MARFVYPCPLRWSDMDAFGHVNNTEFFRYLEEARVNLLFARASQVGVATLAEGIVVARHDIDYQRPLAWRPEPVLIEARVTRIGAASFTLAYQIRDDNHIYATASSVMVPYSQDEGRPRRLTEPERTYLAGFLTDEEVTRIPGE